MTMRAALILKGHDSRQMIKDLKKKYRELDTIEKKSFWAVAPLVMLAGIATIFLTASFFSSPVILIIAGIVAIFPLIMMIVCIKIVMVIYYLP